MGRTRREFLADVGRGMLIAGVGPAVAAELGLIPTRGAEVAPAALTFGDREPLVCLMEETAPDKLLPILVERLRGGLELRELVAAAALANARKFGGEDYVGFHTMMALSPAYAMSRELPAEQRPLPVLKVLFRNANRIQQTGGHKNEVLRPVAPAEVPGGKPGAEALRDAVQAKNLSGAEATFAALARGKPEDAYNDLLLTVQDNTEVHRIVLAYRAWDMLDILGKDQAHTLLRQSVHYCVKAEGWPGQEGRRNQLRTLLPKLLDQFKLLSRPEGTRAGDDAWVDEMAQTIVKATPAQAAEAAAAALADGMAPAALSEALSLAANQLLLRDEGRPKGQTSPGKPIGSVHGDSIGVHASDSANAWRNIARVANHRNRVASLILGAYQVALDRVECGGDFLKWQPYPRPEHLEKVKGDDRDAMLKEAEAGIRGNDQARAAAAVHRYGSLGGSPEAVVSLLLRYAISEDGALHAEKYFRTATDDFATTRPAFRWRHLVSLARVTASEFGQPAPGHEEACKLLKV